MDELERAMLREGYAPGRPASRIASDDELMCALQGCPTCRTMGLDYRPFLARTAPSGTPGYRIVAACPCCGWAREL